jgi:hypothetical protein
MSHMGSSGADCQSGAGCGSSRIVTYTATGSEGSSFMVSIGTTLSNDDYAVLWAPSGVQNIPLLDLPNALAGDRTTTQFRVTIGGEALAAGEVLTFVIFE